jgi:hypothetical protein
MRPAEDTRHDNLLRLIESHGGQRALADSIDKSPAQISQWVNRAPNSRTGTPRTISGASAREIESRLGLPAGWIDQPHGTVHVAAAITAVETVTIGPLSHAPNPVLLTRAITEAAAAFRRARRLPTDASLARVAALAYQILSAGQALAASRRALDEAMQKAITEEPLFQQE